MNSFNITKDSIGELALALSKAQGIFKPLIKSAENPFYKSNYATLADQWDSVREALSSNELALIQTTETENEKLVLRSTLLHSSGESVSCIYPVTARGRTLKDKSNNVVGEEAPDAQAIGSAISYARRYSMAAILGLAAEEDDDGNAATAKGGENKPKQDKPTSKPPEQTDKGRKQSQSEIAFWAMAGKLGMDEAKAHVILKAIVNKDSVKDMTESDWTKINSVLSKTLNSGVKIAQELGNSITVETLGKFIASKENWSWNEAINFYNQKPEEFASDIISWINAQMQPGLQ